MDNVTQFTDFRTYYMYAVAEVRFIVSSLTVITQCDIITASVVMGGQL